jgi:short-subunit dehydrogenase
MEKMALITGGTSGIGLAYARYFAARGYELILTGSRAELAGIARGLSAEFRVPVVPFILKIENEGDIDALLEFLGDSDIDVLVNNAGYGIRGAFFDGNVDDYLSMVNLHALLPMRLIARFLPAMLRKNEGIIVNLSSDSAYRSFPGNAVYAGTKAFVKQFGEVLFFDARRQGRAVKIISVCPGLTRTGFHGKLGMSAARQKNRGLLRW